MQITGNEHQRWMEEALKEARRAFELDEVPVGAVVVHQGKVIGRGYNMVEKLRDTTAHAEMLALTSAMETLGKKFLTDCALYVTIEPCLMCMGAILHSRISLLIYGAPEPKMGFFSLGYTLPPSTCLQIIPDVESGQSRTLMRLFFQKKREVRKK